MADEDKRICASWAKDEYGLTDRDLEPLHYIACRNPYYRCAAPMRLYLVEDLERVVAEKEARRQYELAHADEIAAQKQAAAKRAKAAQLERAKRAISRFSTPPEKLHAGSLPVPPVVWELVLAALVHPVEDYTGLRTPGVVAQDIANAACACRDMRAAAHVGWIELARCLPLQLHDVPGSLVADPQSATLPYLRAAARELGVPVSGNKPIVIVNVLAGLGLKQPSNVPPTVLLSVKKDLQRPLSYNILNPLSALGAHLGSASAVAINKMVLAHFGSLNNLQILADQRIAEEKERRRQEQERRRQEQELNRQAKKRRKQERAALHACAGKATCSNKPAQACAVGCCRECCRLSGAVCQRHGSGKVEAVA